MSTVSPNPPHLPSPGTDLSITLAPHEIAEINETEENTNEIVEPTVDEILNTAGAVRELVQELEEINDAKEMPFPISVVFYDPRKQSILDVYGQGQEKSGKGSAFNALKIVPEALLQFGARLPLISFFQLFFYSAIYDSPRVGNRASHALALQSQQLLGDLLLDGESKISVNNLTRKVFESNTSEDRDWVMALTNFKLASELLLTKTNSSSLKVVTSQQMSIKYPFSNNKVLYLVLRKLQKNLIIFNLKRKELCGCFEEWKIGMHQALDSYQLCIERSLEGKADLQPRIRTLFFDLTSELQEHLEQLLKPNPLSSYVDFFYDLNELVCADPTENLYQVFVKNNGERIESLYKKMEEFEKKFNFHLAKSVEYLAYVRNLDRFLSDHPPTSDPDQEQLRFDLLTSYSKHAAVADPNQSFWVAVPIRENLKHKDQIFFKASGCFLQLHRFLLEFRSISRSTLGVTLEEMQTLGDDIGTYRKEKEKRTIN